jgi:hypothetical protein
MTLIATRTVAAPPVPARERRSSGARYAMPISVGAALISAAAAGFAAGYEIVWVSGARRRAPALPVRPPR